MASCKPTLRRVCLAAGLWALAVRAAFAQPAYPPPTLDIHAAHPLFIFHTAGVGSADPSVYAQGIINVWDNLDPVLKPFSALQVGFDADSATTRHELHQNLLRPLQDADVPVLVQVADADPARVYPIQRIEDLFREFGIVKGIEVAGFRFGEYENFGGDPDLSMPPNVRWLLDAMDVSARYGRFIVIALDDVHWARAMTQPWSARLYAKMRECAPYVTPVARMADGHVVAQMSTLMGVWLDGAAGQWGIAATSEWYENARFIAPQVFGVPESADAMPPAVYRAQVLNGAMIGASVYVFERGDHLWFGAGRRYWDEAIAPVLTELVERGYIARKDFVQQKARVAYQLAEAGSPQSFHLNLRDIDPIYDRGLLIRGVYGTDMPVQMPELVPNTGRYYWIPFLPPHASALTLEQFSRVIQPGALPTAEEWRSLLDSYYLQDGQGDAFISRVGRAVFVLHTLENLHGSQSYILHDVPAPVRAFEASRTDAGVRVAWPRRDGDLSYNVFRRDLQDGPWVRLAKDIEPQEWLDTAADATRGYAYSVTALTNEQEPCSGTVNFGDYLALSLIESRIAEEVWVTPLLGFGRSRPVEPSPPADAAPWWPSFEGVPPEHAATAEAIASRIVVWDTAFSAADIKNVLDIYATSYEDPEHWQFPYVRRAYQWFFERYRFPHMDRQIRRWDFSDYPSSGYVRVLLYCRFSGTALSDPTGRIADERAWFPRYTNGETWLTFSKHEGPWRIIRSEPAVPNFKDILSFSIGPGDPFTPGPDLPTDNTALP